MAQRRMFSLEVVDTDLFLEMPASSQSLYFHLGMRADDDGFVSSPKRITNMVNCSLDDLKLLIGKGLIYTFENGIVVITDWKLNNYIPKDRYRETKYIEEKKALSVDKTGSYKFLNASCIQDVSKTYTECIQDVSKLDTQVRLGKDRLDKGSKKKKAA